MRWCRWFGCCGGRLRQGCRPLASSKPAALVLGALDHVVCLRLTAPRATAPPRQPRCAGKASGLPVLPVRRACFTGNLERLWRCCCHHRRRAVLGGHSSVTPRPTDGSHASHANKGSAPHASRSPTGPATPSHMGTSNAALGASASGRRAHHPSLPKHCELTRVSRRKQPQAALAQDRTPPRCRTRLSWCLSQPRPGARDRRDAAALPTDRPRRHRRPVPDPASGTDRYKCGRVASMARPSGADAA